MRFYESHLTVLEQSAALYPSAPAFRVPRIDHATGKVHDWSPISYQRFKEDVEFTARHWCAELEARGIPQRSVVGLWCVVRGFEVGYSSHTIQAFWHVLSGCASHLWYIQSGICTPALQHTAPES